MVRKISLLGAAVAAICLPSLGRAQSDVVGEWGPVMNWPLVAIHMVHLPTGKILMWGRGQNGDYAQVYDPVADTFTPVGSDGTDIFCAGMIQISDGRVLVVGGHVADYTGVTDAMLFNPWSMQWTRLPNMAYPRWYPTCTSFGDGRVLITTGDKWLDPVTGNAVLADIPELFDPQTMTITPVPTAKKGIPTYPHIFLQPDGSMMAIGRLFNYFRLNPTTMKWYLSPVNGPLIGTSAAQYLPGKMVKIGGLATYSSLDAVNLAAKIDTLDPAGPSFAPLPNMAYPRQDADLTILPDGKLLVSGGSTQNRKQYTAVLPAEMYDPATETFTTLSSMDIGRLYHSTALLMPDGRVLIAGSGTGGKGRNTDQNWDQLNAQYYSPSYLFKGPRPVVNSAPDLITYRSNNKIVTPDADSISKVVLIRLGAVTHAIDMSQNYVPLSFTKNGTTLNVTGPYNGNYAQPGWYMLFLLNNSGVPSVAKYVLVSERQSWQLADSFGILAGTSSDASLSELADVNDATMNIDGDGVNPPQLEVDFISPLNHISAIDFDIRSGWAQKGLRRVEFYDNNINDWAFIGEGTDTSMPITTRFEKVGYTDPYIEPGTRRIRVRVTWLNPAKPDPAPAVVDKVTMSVAR